MTISLAQQVDLLFKYGQDRGLPSTYRAVAEATGETTNNLFRIRRGHNLNPGLRTVSALVNYFSTDLGYFSCKSKADCLKYLKTRSKRVKWAILRHNRRTKSR